MRTSLNLDCGCKPKNFGNADFTFAIHVRDDLESTITKADLVIEKIHFYENTFDIVTAHDFIEYIPRLIYTPERRLPFVELKNEVWTVLKFEAKFLTQTSCYQHPAAEDPTYVNSITDQTFSLYFDDTNKWASMYGFKGQFQIEQQPMNGQYLILVIDEV